MKLRKGLTTDNTQEMRATETNAGCALPCTVHGGAVSVNRL